MKELFKKDYQMYLSPDIENTFTWNEKSITKNVKKELKMKGERSENNIIVFNVLPDERKVQVTVAG